MSEKVGTGFVPIKPDTKGFGAELEKGVEKEGGPAAERSGGKLAKVMTGAFLAGAALIGKSVVDFGGFEKQMNEVFTLLPGISGEAMGKMTEQVKGFATEFGVLPQEVVPALYQSLSAGVPKDNVFEFLEGAQKLAKGGVTDLTTAVDGLTGVTNAYGLDVVSTQKASDLMFTTVKMGKTTISELSKNLGNVTPVASALGVTFEDVSAGMATLTLTLGDTGVASTQMRQLFVEMSKDGSKAADVFTEASGKSFKDFLAAGGTVKDALQLMEDTAAGSGKSISDLFGSVEAGSAALILTSDSGSEAFATNMDAMGNAAGATEAAYDQMNQGLSATIDKLKAKFSVVLLNIGEQIAPSLLAVGNAVGSVLEIFAKLPGPIQAGIVLVGTLTAGMFAFAKPIMTGIALFQKLGGVMKLLAANPWVLVALALVTVAVLIIKNWDKVKAVLGAVFDWIKTAGKAVGDFFVNLWTTVAGGVTAAWDAIFAKVDAVIGGIIGAAQTVGNTIAGIYNSIIGIGEAVVGFITGIPNAISSAFTTLAEVMTAPFRAAFGAIKALWNSTIGGFGFKTPDWIPVLGGKSFTIPSMAAGGVLTGPQMFLGGEYPGATQNPEIVTPQNIMRQTVTEAIQTAAPAGAQRPINITGNTFVVRDDRDIEAIARELDRLHQREARAQGMPILAGVNR